MPLWAAAPLGSSVHFAAPAPCALCSALAGRKASRARGLPGAQSICANCGVPTPPRPAPGRQPLQPLQPLLPELSLPGFGIFCFQVGQPAKLHNSPRLDGQSRRGPESGWQRAVMHLVGSPLDLRRVALFPPLPTTSPVRTPGESASSAGYCVSPTSPRWASFGRARSVPRLLGAPAVPWRANLRNGDCFELQGRSLGGSESWILSGGVSGSGAFCKVPDIKSALAKAPDEILKPRRFSKLCFQPVFVKSHSLLRFCGPLESPTLV